MALLTGTHQKDLLTSLLRDVSRSFYLTLRVLPEAVRAQVGLAYLLARATDTIADTDVLPVARRLESLARLRGRIASDGSEIVSNNRGAPRSPGGAGDFRELAGRQVSPAERRLLERVDDTLAVLAGFEQSDRHRIREVLDIIASGQELDLRRFDGASAERVTALNTDAELDDYIYRVAGCVGEFWTRMSLAHLFPTPANPEAPGESTGWFESCGIEFGKGLQLVNILRDLPRDLRQGRCYVPAALLARAGLRPEDLLFPANEATFRSVYDPLLDRAERYLRSGACYVAAIPQSQYRMRLACALPVLIGVRTLVLLRKGPVLDPAHRIKVSRAEVRSIVVRSILALPRRRTWARLLEW